MRIGERGRLPRWHRALRAPVQPAKPSPHGVHRVWQFSGIFLPRSRPAGTRDRTPPQLRDHPAHVSDLRRLRRLPKSVKLVPESLGRVSVETLLDLSLRPGRDRPGSLTLGLTRASGLDLTRHILIFITETCRSEPSCSPQPHLTGRVLREVPSLPARSERGPLNQLEPIN